MTSITESIKCNPQTKEDCDKCEKLNNFPYDNCCLFECGSLEQCNGCEIPDKPSIGFLSNITITKGEGGSWIESENQEKD